MALLIDGRKSTKAVVLILDKSILAWMRRCPAIHVYKSCTEFPREDFAITGKFAKHRQRNTRK